MHHKWIIISLSASSAMSFFLEATISFGFDVANQKILFLTVLVM